MKKKSSNNIVLISCIFLLSLTTLFIELETVMATKRKKATVNIGAIFDNEYDRTAKVGSSCIDLALSDFNNTHPHLKSKFLLHTKDIKKRDSTVSAAIAAMELIKSKKVQAILLGPASPAQTSFIIELGEKAKVPIISFSESSYCINSNRSPYFFTATRSDTYNQAKAIAAIIKSHKWREAVPIFVDNECGQGVIPYLTDAFQALDISVPYWSPISPSATCHQIRQQLEKLKAMPNRVFVVHMYPDLGSRLFPIAKEIGMMENGYVWILTDQMTNFLHSLDPLVIDSMQSVLGIRPYVPKTKTLKDFELQWEMKFYKDDPDMVVAGLNIYGQLAYDATIALAKAFEKLDGSKNFSLATRKGPRFVQALRIARFKDLTGDFQFVDQKLKTYALEVVNVVSEGVNGVGCWTLEHGLVNLGPLTKGHITDHNSNWPCNFNAHASIMWPGNSMSAPNGWQIPTNGTKLRVLVPLKLGFRQFVNATGTPGAETSYNITGYCKDIFEIVLRLVPYGPKAEYTVFNGTYDQLVQQVSNNTYDAAVGDVTITGDRCKIVDFTLPYINSGVYLIMPTEERLEHKAWEFLKPLSWQLWLTTICFFIYIAFVVWVLEHKINEEFQGSSSRQIGTSVCFSFSTMVFAQRERVVSNLTRAVVIVWCFVGLILTQSYTASFTTYLTLKNFQPYLDLNELMRHNVGYQKGSFVRGTLEALGFDKYKLIEYGSAEECHQLFLNGSITAAFDEFPYAKLILQQSCGNYTMIDPFSNLKVPYWKNFSKIQKLRTDGIGFAFPKGSPLAALVSSAIPQFIDSEDFKDLEEKWLGNLSCDSNLNGNNRLGLSTFMGLFLISGAVSLLALIIYAAMFVYQYKKVVMSSGSRMSLWSAISHLLIIFNQTDKQTKNAPTGSIPANQGALSPEHPSHPNANRQTPGDFEPNFGEVTTSANTNQETQTSTGVVRRPNIVLAIANQNQERQSNEVIQVNT